MAHFVIIRHGESVLNVVNQQGRVFCGQTETPLTERGREQARVAGRQLAAWKDLVITTAISSALERTRQTLDLMLPELPYAVRRLPDSPALNERSLGLFDGCRAADVYAQHPQYRDDPAFNQFDNHFTQKAPGGENLREVTDRAWAVIEELDRSHAGDILIVSHFTTIRCILGRALGLLDETVRRIRVPNTVLIIVQRGSRYRLLQGLELPDA
jgi:broad specificity phosphatase PhoE